MITCKPGKPRKRKVKVTCTVAFTAGRSSRMVTARIVRGHTTYASARRTVKAGRQGNVALRARRSIPRGRYQLVLTFLDRAGARDVIVQPVEVR